MTEAEIILLMVKCVPIVLAGFIFCHLLCEEYLRALESRGLIRRRPPATGTEITSPEAREKGAGKASV